jgi:catechol 2,3-dioxygenase-like lactoylglutathione lyase family enzyme
MLDHIGLSTTRLKDMYAFYEAVLAPLGYSKQKDYGVAAGFGKDGDMPLWIGEGKAGSAVHLAIAAANRAEVDAFYQAAMANGGKDNGGPGTRAHYHENYYAAFVFDPDGNNLEAVCHQPAA